ncbi:hypothetical protein [Nocardia sp. CA-290969]|uniref:hypothetical protein n=1 Tax=Nocardia sp. CA-290969 TaxID=3239986 RepID=UPI003D948A17
MTLFGLDISNHQSRDGFDGERARREGFAFITHKITEGTWRDPYWPRERDETWPLFPGRFGGYVFCRTNTPPADELGATLEHARDAAGRIPPLQIDYEDTVNGGSIDDLWARITEAQRLGFHLLPIYLPRWYWRDRMGSPRLADLPVGIWNSDYVRGIDYASRLYPGDGYAGWADMGGKRVEILQFTDTAIAAGESPCDANAFRGSETELDALFGASKEDIMSDASDVATQLLGADRKGFGILGKAVETDAKRNRYLTEAVAVLLTQLAGGPNFEGWSQLGEGEEAEAARAKTAEAPKRTVVDAAARLLELADELVDQGAAHAELLRGIDAKLDQLLGGQ